MYSMDLFKQAFKRYKTKWPTPDLDDVIDFDSCAQSDVVEVACNANASDFCDKCPPLPCGLKPPHTWRCYTLPAHTGLLVIRNPFTVRAQRYWIARSLRDFPRAPNMVNLNASLFTAAAIADWWSQLQQCNDKDEARRLKISMRWATLGYHHNWDTKVYSEDRHTPFPPDLAQLCQYFARVLGQSDFEAQAAITNYYPIGTTLSGHTDHSELNQQAPLFSFSFGQTAVFLIGGTTRNVEPRALYLHSGDVLVMSQQSRLCYHAVPRIMKAPHEPWNELLTPDNDELCAAMQMPQPLTKRLRLDPDAGCGHDGHAMDLALYQQVADEHFWLPYQQYLNDSRINVNVRQVLAPGQLRLAQ